MTPTRAVFEEAVLDLLRLARAAQTAVEGSDTLAGTVLGAIVAPFTADTPVGPRSPHSVNCKTDGGDKMTSDNVITVTM